MTYQQLVLPDKPVGYWPLTVIKKGDGVRVFVGGVEQKHRPL